MLLNAETSFKKKGLKKVVSSQSINMDISHEIFCTPMLGHTPTTSPKPRPDALAAGPPEKIMVNLKSQEPLYQNTPDYCGDSDRESEERILREIFHNVNQEEPGSQPVTNDPSQLTGIAKILANKHAQSNIHYCVYFNKEIIDSVEEFTIRPKHSRLAPRIGYLFSEKLDFNRALKSMLKKKKNLLDLVHGHNQSYLFEDHFQKTQTKLCSICYKFSMLLDDQASLENSGSDWATKCRTGNKKVYFEKCGHVIHENCCEV